MSILGYILHRIKDFLLGPRASEHYPVQCWKCGRSLIVTQGLERQQLEHHFTTAEHQTGEQQ